jgi:uncharacterized protein YlzI (FlbEa/FlbD family)
MIVLHRLGGEHAAFHLNPDLIQTIESTPDCMVALTTGTKMLVEETPEEVADAVRAFRVQILEDALRRKR